MRQLVKKLNMQVTTANATPSALGDSRIEVSPLGLRISSVLDLTEDVLRRAGIERGMRVLDLECGAGNAALSIAKLIGPSGLVVGVDRSREAIDVAEKRATVAGYCYWTRFVAEDPNTFVPYERFDAVVVRPTLFRQGERATFLRLSACVRPDGVIMVASGKPPEMPIRFYIELARDCHDRRVGELHSARMSVSRHRSRRGGRRLLDV
jgi:ubiquinone/menaquinone biosynthesis C-methylase UbiE